MFDTIMKIRKTKQVNLVLTFCRSHIALRKYILNNYYCINLPLKNNWITYKNSYEIENKDTIIYN